LSAHQICPKVVSSFRFDALKSAASEASQKRLRGFQIRRTTQQKRELGRSRQASPPAIMIAKKARGMILEAGRR
jgi:hypothetical protein